MSTEPGKNKESLRLGHVGSLRTRVIQNILSSRQDWLPRRRRERRGFDGHVYDICCDPPVEGFRFLLSRATTGEKKRDPQDELVTAFFDISEAHFHSPVRRKVAIRMQGDPSCSSGIAMLNRAMYGTKDAAQCFDSYCERTMEKLEYNIGVCSIRACTNILSKTLAYSDTVMILRHLRHGLRSRNSRKI